MRNTSRSSALSVLGATLLLVVVAARSTSAHRQDEYLQAARIGLQPDGVLIALDLTPGIAVAESIIAMIDRDADGVLSEEEQRAYTGQVVAALEVTLDNGPLALRLISSTFPDLSAFRRGVGTIRLETGATHRRLSTGTHRLFLRNTHLGANSVYLANALVPENVRVSVTGQQRDSHQRELTIDYAVRAESSGATLAWLFVSLTAVLATLWFTRR